MQVKIASKYEQMYALHIHDEIVLLVITFLFLTI